MRFNLNFIKEFIEIDIEPTKLKDSLTMAGMEVEHIEKVEGDWVFEVEITSNRYDWLSMVGIAREISAILNKKMNIKYPKIKEKQVLERKIIIENQNDCPFYVGRVIKNIKVKDSPEYIYKNLKCTLNSINNNVVDITNYCMLKWGNPLHAFDEDKIEGNIYIRRAKNNEKFIGIDGKEYTLKEENLVISDDKKIIALAGIMGAKNTEITKDTKNVFLEAAIFSPITIRRSKRVVGIDTESSYRFERKVFYKNLEFASIEATSLLEKFADGFYYGYKEVPKKPIIKEKKIIISISSLNNYLGTNIKRKNIVGILKRLDFKIKTKKDKLIVSPPLYRLDIDREVDIYEEVARLYGYNNIETRIPPTSVNPEIRSNYDFKNEIKNLLVNLGFNEIISYSIVAQKELERLKYNNFIKLVNPLREEENALRVDLILSMIKTIRYNLNRKRENLKFFELANVYFKENNKIYEKPMLCISVIGELENFFYLKGSIEEILKLLVDNFYFKEDRLNNFDNALKIFKENTYIGFLGKLNKIVLEDFDIKTNIFFANLDIEVLENLKSHKFYKPFSIYQSIWHDISLTISKNVKFKEIENIIKSKPYITDIKIINIYKTKDTEVFTIRIFYQSDQRTLTSQEINTIHNSIREELAKLNGVIIK